MKADPIVVLAGSRALPAGVAPRLVVRFLASLPIGAKVLLRAPKVNSGYGDFEVGVWEVCDIIGIPVEWRRPNPTRQRPGRKAVWDRDMEMLADADLVLCFYGVGQIGDEESGTVALVDKAMSLDVPVYAYAITADQKLVRVGEHDPKNIWAELVPAP